MFHSSGKVFILYIAFVVCFYSTSNAQQATAESARPVDIVFTLDLSGSTNGLVDNIRDKMWDVINQWKMFRPTPKLRIGIVGFSRISFTGSSGYVKILCDLTDDYDVVSNSLFNLSRSVENGHQFIGAAMETTITSMDWSTNSSALKIVYLIGNGKVNLGRIDFRKQCEEAVKKNIIINTVYCNKTIRDNRANDITGWIEIATSTGGEQYDTYVNKRAPLFNTKANLATLSAYKDSLNATYLPYGKNGTDRLRLMQEADDNASLVYSSYLYSRLKYKFSEEYRMKQFLWDIVTYKQEYPDTKLSALKVNPNKENPISGNVSLEDYVNANLKNRNKISDTIMTYFPEGEEQRVQTEIALPDYDLNNLLDRVLIVSYYKLALKNGFKPLTGADNN
ncbi:MAG TPA: VWA domain-containing protein [Bacteroidia bacterium]|nr:VWA domain-containing protein [Bacteroidia bacterium]HNU34630.1 VWA domain-containing protein [Bacteroidia bacterium]